MCIVYARLQLMQILFLTSILHFYEQPTNQHNNSFSSLDGWIQQFTYMKNYPVLGKLIPDDKLPSSDRVISKEDLLQYKGEGEIPDGYAAAPIYLCAGGDIFDMSFGGATFYGKGCSYHRFAGVDASRALAKMSFDPKDVENTDCSDLTEKEQKVLSDWIKTFKERKGK